MYAQMMFFSLLSALFLLQALERKRRLWWGLYSVSLAAGMYTHIFTALNATAHLLWVLLYQRPQWRAYFSSTIAAALAFLPWCIFLPWVRNFFLPAGTAQIIAGAPSAGGQAEALWAALPYSFFVYGVGFSLGPPVAALHVDKSLEVILRFLPIALLVGLTFGALLVMGIVSAYKQLDSKRLIFCLFSLGLPFLGAAVYAVSPKATFNVRYTITASPYFCLFLGVALASGYQSHKKMAVILTALVVGLTAVSLKNHFFNPQYMKEDVRAVVALWQSMSKDEPLFSYKSKYTANRYLEASERARHTIIRRIDDTASVINATLSTTPHSSAYVIVARDWRQRRENDLRQAFTIDFEQSFVGSKLFKISKQPQ